MYKILHVARSSCLTIVLSLITLAVISTALISNEDITLPSKISELNQLQRDVYNEMVADKNASGSQVITINADTQAQLSSDGTWKVLDVSVFDDVKFRMTKDEVRELARLSYIQFPTFDFFQGHTVATHDAFFAGIAVGIALGLLYWFLGSIGFYPGDVDDVIDMVGGALCASVVGIAITGWSFLLGYTLCVGLLYQVHTYNVSLTEAH